MASSGEGSGGEYRTSVRRLLEGKQLSFIPVSYDGRTAVVRKVFPARRYATTPRTPFATA